MALKDLQVAEEALLKVGQLASTRLREIWNPDTRRYETHEEMVVLHEIINTSLTSLLRVRRQIREMEP